MHAYRPEIVSFVAVSPHAWFGWLRVCGNKMCCMDSVKEEMMLRARV
jgi:hypothetical protein